MIESGEKKREARRLKLCPEVMSVDFNDGHDYHNDINDDHDDFNDDHDGKCCTLTLTWEM